MDQMINLLWSSLISVYCCMLDTMLLLEENCLEKDKSKTGMFNSSWKDIKSNTNVSN